MEEQLTKNGWEKVDASQYRNTGTGDLLLHDETGWYLQPALGKRKKVGRTLKQAIQEILGAQVAERGEITLEYLILIALIIGTGLLIGSLVKSSTAPLSKAAEAVEQAEQAIK